MCTDGHPLHNSQRLPPVWGTSKQIQSIILKGCKMFPHIHFQLEENDIIIQHLPVLRLKKMVKFAQKPSAVALQF